MSPLGNCQAAHLLLLGLGPEPSPDLCLSFVWGQGTFPLLLWGPLRVQSTQCILALSSSFPYLLGFVSLGPLGTLCFLFYLASSCREHLTTQSFVAGCWAGPRLPLDLEPGQAKAL